MTDIVNKIDDIKAIASAYTAVLSGKTEEEVKELAEAQAFIDQTHIMMSKDFDYPDSDNPTSMAIRQSPFYIQSMNTFIKVGYQLPAFANTGKMIKEAISEYKNDPEAAKEKVAFAKAVADATKSINDVVSKATGQMVNINVDRREVNIAPEEKAKMLRESFKRQSY